MNTDQTSGAGAYKADTADTAVVQREDRGFKPPFHLNLSKGREVKLDYRQTAVAAGALALGYAAFKGVQALIGRGAKKAAVAAGHTGQLEPVPLAESATPSVKDNAAPRFAGEETAGTGAQPFAPAPETTPGLVGEQPSQTDERPFVAASDQDDTADLVVEVTEIDVVAITPIPTDRSAETGEHVPTDLMGDEPPTANDRAIDAFRPDPTAPVPEGMRDSLRPATGTPPGFAAARGTFASGLSQTDGSK